MALKLKKKKAENGEAAPPPMPVRSASANPSSASAEDKRAKTSIQDRILIALGVIAFFITGYFLFFGIPAGWFGELQKIGSIQSEANIRRRHSGTLSWQTMKGTNDVYLRDIIYVPKGAVAQVKLSSKSFEIPSDTMVQFDESAQDQFEITLLDLKVAALPVSLPQHKTKLSNLLGDLTPYEVWLSELKSRTFSAIFEAPPLAKAFPMNPNNFALDKLADYEIRLLEPQPDRYNLRAYRWMKMGWTPVPLDGVSYTLEVSKDSRFRKMLPHNTKTNRILVQFDDESTFYWRVRGVKADDETLSESLSFTMVLRGGKTPTLPLIRGLGGFPDKKR